jgi:hypothetical protein
VWCIIRCSSCNGKIGSAHDGMRGMIADSEHIQTNRVQICKHLIRKWDRMEGTTVPRGEVEKSCACTVGRTPRFAFQSALRQPLDSKPGRTLIGLIGIERSGHRRIGSKAHFCVVDVEVHCLCGPRTDLYPGACVCRRVRTPRLEGPRNSCLHRVTYEANALF